MSRARPICADTRSQLQKVHLLIWVWNTIREVQPVALIRFRLLFPFKERLDWVHPGSYHDRNSLEIFIHRIYVNSYCAPRTYISSSATIQNVQPNTFYNLLARVTCQANLRNPDMHGNRVVSLTNPRQKWGHIIVFSSLSRTLTLISTLDCQS